MADENSAASSRMTSETAAPKVSDRRRSSPSIAEVSAMFIV